MFTLSHFLNFSLSSCSHRLTGKYNPLLIFRKSRVAHNTVTKYLVYCQIKVWVPGHLVSGSTGTASKLCCLGTRVFRVTIRDTLVEIGSNTTELDMHLQRIPHFFVNQPKESKSVQPGTSCEPESRKNKTEKQSTIVRYIAKKSVWNNFPLRGWAIKAIIKSKFIRERNHI